MEEPSSKAETGKGEESTKEATSPKTTGQTQSEPAPIPEGDTVIEAQDPADEAAAAAGEESDDGYATDGASTASISVTSSVRDYEFENSRRYHKFQEGKYAFPNDEPEQEREAMKHAMVVHLCNGQLHLAPLQNPQNILDIGTGTGIWAIDMGDEYPEAEIMGVDLSPIQPTWVPQNVRFMVDDVEQDWLQEPNSLDYIHVRFMTAAVKDWPRLLASAYRALKPGGWLELQDMCFQLSCDDGTMREDSKIRQFFPLLEKGLQAFNVDLHAVLGYKDQTLDAGFTNVEEKRLKIPFGLWPRDQKMKKIGLYCRTVVFEALQGVASKPFIHGLKWTPEEIEVYLIDVRKSCMDTSQHTYLPFHVVLAQKPV